MPDFDTRKPQEPNHPSKTRVFVAAIRRYVSTIDRLKDRSRVRRHWMSAQASALDVRLRRAAEESAGWHAKWNDPPST